MKKAGNLVLWALVIVFVLAAAYTVYSKNKANSNAIQPPQLNTGTADKAQSSGKKAPDFTLNDLNGKAVKLSDYKGKVVFLNFWASWCPPCKAEMPGLNRANQELVKGNDAVLLTVNEGENADVVKNFLAGNKYTFYTLLDKDGKVGNAYNVTGIPTTYIINRDGSIYDFVVGPISEDKMLGLAKSLK